MFKRLKEKYIKNKKLYHTYRYFKYKLKFLRAHSAFGEDVFLNKIFFNNNTGFFVDIGALHPINGSLTYNLYKKGWNGLNIDMVEENLRLFKKYRKRDINLNYAMSSKKGLINAFIFEQGSGLNTTNKIWAEKWKKKINKNYSIRKVKRSTLTCILNQYKVKSSFELLNIDVEGHELEVLKGINLKKFKPKLISIEIHVKKTSDIFNTQIYKILKKNDYDLISQYFQTSFFKSKDFKIN